MNKPIKLRLYTLAPVHIGCDDVYEPTSFKIDSDRKKLVAFNPIDFVKLLSEKDRQELVKICDEGGLASIIKLYKFISNHQIAGREIDIAQELISHYQSVCRLSVNDKKSQNELNKFEILRTAYNPHNDFPYIPGSSLKGAIRTAYLSKLAIDKNIKGRKRNKKKGEEDPAKKLEKELLQGSFETNPFRMVKVSDFSPAGNVTARIVYAIDKKKDPNEKRSSDLYQILEVIKENSIFEGVINIETPLLNSGIKNPINQPALLESLNNFYLKQFRVDEEDLKGLKINSDNISGILSKLKDSIGKTVFLVRVGRHSGAESVTIEGNREIKIKPKKGGLTQYLDHATTMWLASDTRKPAPNENLAPFGWVLLEMISEEKSSVVEPLLDTQEKSPLIVVEQSKPKSPVKSEFETFSEQIAGLVLSGKDWSRISSFVNDIKKMKVSDDQKKSAQLLVSKIKEAKKPKDYSQKTWYSELEKMV